MINPEYEALIERKRVKFQPVGFEFPAEQLNHALFPFQRAIVHWALRRGRAAIFSATGTGKTRMQLAYAEHIPGRVLILAPLAVAQQTVRESGHIGIETVYARYDNGARIIVTNYEMMDRFDLSRFAGIVLDESSAIKAYNSQTRNAIIAAVQNTPYRLSCTATPSPNSWTELGNQVEFLGVMNRAEMLAMYFCHDGGNTSQWRLKGHGKQRFWEFMSTWAVVLNKPSDLGFEDTGYNLPELRIHKSVIEADNALLDGELFARSAQTLNERRQAKRMSISHRVAEVAKIVNDCNEQFIVWCHLNDEADALTDAIPDAVEVRGPDSPDSKEQALLGFANQEFRVLVSKPSICGHGMNWQQCCKMAFVGLNDSFEEYHHAIRRIWRFGQTRRVDVYIFSASTEGSVLANIEQKERMHIEMSKSMTTSMRDLMKEQVLGAVIEKTDYHPAIDMALPAWL